MMDIKRTPESGQGLGCILAIAQVLIGEADAKMQTPVRTRNRATDDSNTDAGASSGLGAEADSGVAGHRA